MFSMTDLSRKAQERRLAQLSEDNAFVDIKTVLSSSSAKYPSGGGSSQKNALHGSVNKGHHGNRDENAMEIESRFFQGVTSAGSAPLTNNIADKISGRLRMDQFRPGEFRANGRLNLTQCFAQQHKDYEELFAQTWKEANEDQVSETEVPIKKDDLHNTNEIQTPKVGQAIANEEKRANSRQVKRGKSGKTINSMKEQQFLPEVTSIKGQLQRQYSSEERVRGWRPTEVVELERELSKQGQILHAWYCEMDRFSDSDEDSELEYSHVTRDPGDISKGTNLQLKKNKKNDALPSGEKKQKDKSNHEEPHSLPPSVLRFLSRCPSYSAMTSPSPLSSVASDTKSRAKKVPGLHTHHLCSVCLLPAPYHCARCQSALFCSIKCHVAHDATRCMKYTV